MKQTKITYPSIFHKDEKDGGYWVDIPNLPGCVTEGDTLEEAVLQAGDALNLWIKMLRKVYRILLPSTKYEQQRAI